MPETCRWLAHPYNTLALREMVVYEDYESMDEVSFSIENLLILLWVKENAPWPINALGWEYYRSSYEYYENRTLYRYAIDATLSRYFETGKEVSVDVHSICSVKDLLSLSDKELIPCIQAFYNKHENTSEVIATVIEAPLAEFIEPWLPYLRKRTIELSEERMMDAIDLHLITAGDESRRLAFIGNHDDAYYREGHCGVVIMMIVEICHILHGMSGGVAP